MRLNRALQRALPLALALLALVCVRAPAHANSELCPASVESIQRVGGPSSNIFSLSLSAQGPRSVSGTIIIRSGDAWYRASVPSTALTKNDLQWTDEFLSFTQSDYSSAPIYVRVPAAAETAFAYVERVTSSGDAEFGWDAKGRVDCPVSGGFGVPAKYKPPVTLTNPRSDLLQVPSASVAVIDAVPIAAPGSLACATPFAAATVSQAVPPVFPYGERFPGFRGAMTIVTVVVGADGSLIDAFVFVPSGHHDIDAAALEAARESTYQAGTAFCAPAPGLYNFRAQFEP